MTQRRYQEYIPDGLREVVPLFVVVESLVVVESPAVVQCPVVV